MHDVKTHTFVVMIYFFRFQTTSAYESKIWSSNYKIACVKAWSSHNCYFGTRHQKVSILVVAQLYILLQLCKNVIYSAKFSQDFTAERYQWLEDVWLCFPNNVQCSQRQMPRRYSVRSLPTCISFIKQNKSHLAF